MDWKRRLSELQVTDREIDKLEQLEEHLPARAEYQSAEQKLVKQRARMDSTSKDLERRRLELKKVEGELELTNTKIKKEEARLYGGSVTNPKELRSIQEEIKNLRKRVDQGETSLLELMDDTQRMEAELESGARMVRELEEGSSKAKDKYENEMGQIKERLASLTVIRDEAVKVIDPDVVVLYKRLRTEKQGVAVAEIEERVCQGCFVQLAAEEVDTKIRQGGLWRCPNCGRIMV